MENNKKNTKIKLLPKIFKSITNLECYSYFYKESLGKAILYLFLISSIFGLVGSLKEATKTNWEIYDFLQAYNKKITDFQMKSGKLRIDEKMPIIISNRDNDYYIIDISGKTNQSILNGYDKGALILKDKVILKIDQYNTQVIDFAPIGSMTITKSTINSYLPFISVIPLLVSIEMIVWCFFGGLLVAFIVSICVLIFHVRFKAKLGFENLYKISIYSLTTPLLINTILLILKINIPYWSLIYVLITLFYTGLVLRNYDKQTFKNNKLSVN